MDFAKILSKIDSIQSTKQLNESAKPDFLDLDKDGNRKESMKKAAADKKKRGVKEDTVNEVSAPGQEDWIKKNKQRFIDQYGKKKGMEVLYATAWKRSKKVDEARQLEECYGQAMQNMSNQMDDRSGMSVSSSMDTRTGSKTLTVSAEDGAADQLAQMLKLSGLVVGTVGSQDVELEEYANEPAPQVQGIETQLQQGNDLNRPKKMTPHGYQNGDNPLAMDVREQEELSALSQALSEELEGIKVDKSKVPAYKRKQQGGDWKTTQQDLQRERERNISGAEGLAALKKKQGMSEAAKPDYIDLDKDGNRKESMKKAAADKKKRGVAEGKFTINAKTGAKLDPRTGVELPPKEKPMTMKQMFAQPKQPKLTLDDVWRKVEDVVSRIFPDGDPKDHLAPWLEKHGIRDFKIGEILDRAAKKNGYKDLYDYWESMGDLPLSEQGVAEGAAKGRVPKLPRRHFFDTYGGPGNGIAYTDNTHWWKIVDGKVVDFTNSYEGTGEWKRDFVARQRQQGVAEGTNKSTWVVSYTAERKSYDEKPSSVTDEETIVVASSKEEAIAKVKKMSKVGTNMYGFSARPARKSDGLDSDDIAEQRVTEGSAHGFNVVRYYEKTGNQLKIVNWLRKEAGLPKDAPVYFDDADLVYDDKTIVPNALVNPNLKLNDLLTAVIQASGTGRQGKQNVGGIYRESNVAEGFKNTYNVGDRVDGPLGAGTIVAVSKNVNVDGRVKVKLDDPSKAGEDGKHKDSFVLTTTQLKHISE